jgi:hypothetical protein
LLELSLHILDAAENASTAGASIIAVTLGVRESLLEIVIEDNGPGLPAPPDQVLDPFYTTKEKGKGGLGLSLFKATAEQAGGVFELGESTLGGVLVRAVMQIHHIDRPPLGDLAGTLSGVVLASPETDLWVHVSAPEGADTIHTSDIIMELMAKGADDIAIARRFEERVRAATARLPL